MLRSGVKKYNIRFIFLHAHFCLRALGVAADYNETQDKTYE